MRAVILLTIAMLPTCAGTGSAEQQTMTAIHAYSWSEVPATCRHITHMTWFKKDSDPAEIAKASLARPAERRALFSWDMERDLLSHPDDAARTADGKPTEHIGVWPQQGAATVGARFEDFFRRFKEAGGDARLLVLDFEGGYSNWHIGSKNTERWLAIQNDPRFSQIAKRLGFSDLLTVADFRSGTNYLKWNAHTGLLVDEALNKAVFEPARRHFPKIQASNYGSYIVTEANTVPDLHGHMQWREGIPFGTHQSRSFYTSIGQLASKKLDGQNPFGQSPFAGLLLSVNYIRSMKRSSAIPIQPWVAWARYAGDGPNRPPATVGGTPYYRELVCHLALQGIAEFLFWNPHPWRKDQKPESLSLPEDEILLDELLGRINQRLEGASGEPVTVEAAPWNARVVASGMRVKDKILWRFSFAPQTDKVVVSLDGKPVEITPERGEAGAWFTHETRQQMNIPPTP